MNESVEDKVDRLEWKVNLLLALAAFHFVTTILKWIGAVFGSTFWVLVILATMIGLLYTFRKQLPALSGKLIRYVFSERGGDQPNDHS
jgi:hypothetical protein